MGSGPLNGVRVLEFAGLGPAPFCGMLLSDLGADVVRVERKAGAAWRRDLSGRGRRLVALDLKTPSDVEVVRTIADHADILIEGFRPGVMERLGLGPDELLARNPRLIYGRMTGWGQEGPLAQAAGHDINYIALAGALHAIGRKAAPPTPPLNLVGDFGGGALYLAFGVVAALLEARASGKGQVVDCAMVDGVASLMTMSYSLMQAGVWKDERDANMLDGGAHFYDVYECADGKHIALGSIEPQFYALMLEKLELKDDPDFAAQMDRNAWPALSEKIAARVRTKTRDEWCALMEGSDVCFAPVLSLNEAPMHPHNAARGNFVTAFGMLQPNVAPRFSRTPGAIQGPPGSEPVSAEAVAAEWTRLSQG